MNEAGKYARANSDIDTWLIPEHNLNPADAIAHSAIAAARDMAVIIGYAEEGGNGVHWGGTLVLVNERVVTVKSTVCATGGLTVVVTERNGENL